MFITYNKYISDGYLEWSIVFWVNETNRTNEFGTVYLK